MPVILEQSNSSQWAKIFFFFQHALNAGTLTATSEATGFDVENIYDMLEGSLWKATSTADQYITFDAGSGNAYAANYLAVYGHNLKTAGATLVLQYSTDNFASDVHDAFPAFAPTSDNALLVRFSQQNKRYWRIKITGQTVAPFITIGIWGQETELDYATGDFDPHAYTDKANVIVGDTGMLLGVHSRFKERDIDITFEDSDADLYAKIVAWNDFCGLVNFFMAWELNEHAADIWLVRSEARFNNPLTGGGRYRNIKIALKGRKA